MNPLTAYCPRCRRVTPFEEAGRVRWCSACGLQFRRKDAPSSEPSGFGDVVVGIAKVLVMVVLIMTAVVVVGVGVLFAGCAILSGGHF
jgi:uncharacterized protein (DUF983 family)